MLRYGQFEAWLQLEDTTYVNEYVTRVTGNEVSCFVCSTTRLPFSVHWRDNGSKLFTAGYILVDGVKAPGRFLHGMGQSYRNGYRKGSTTEEPFTFTRENGSIQLVLTLVENGEVRRSDNAQTGLAKRDQMFAARGLEYRQVRGYETITVPQQHESTYSVSGVSGKSGPIVVTFTFNYRASDWMEMNGISKMQPNAPPLPISVWNSREYDSQHGEEWPASRKPEPEPKIGCGTEDGMNAAWALRQQHIDELNAAMMEKYGHPTIDWDDPNAVIPEDTVKKPRKPRKAREPARKPEPGVQIEHSLPLPTEPRPQRMMKGYQPRPQSRAPSQPQVEAQSQAQAQPGTPTQAEPGQAEKRAETPETEPWDGPERTGIIRKMFEKELNEGMAAKYGPDWDKPDPPRTYRKRKTATNVRATAADKGKAPEQPNTLRRAMSQIKMSSHPANMQQHPRATNTYVLPSPAPSSSSSASTPRVPLDASYGMQPPPIPYLTPSGRPSAVIDTRFFGYASPAPSEASTSSGYRSGQPTRR